MESKRMLIVHHQKRIFDSLRLKTEKVRFPFDYDWVENGKEAVKLIELGRWYDAIFMDLDAPVADAITATEEIRKLGCKDPIIAWCHDTRSFPWSECRAAGMNEYVRLKPTQPFETVILGLSLCKLIQY